MISILNTNEVTKFLIDNPKITINQVFFCLLHMHDQEYMKLNALPGIRRPLSLIYAYADTRKGLSHTFSLNEIMELEKLGYIKRYGTKYTMDLITVTEKFKRALYGKAIMFEEFRDKYPSYVDNFHHPGKPVIFLNKRSEGLDKKYIAKVKTYKAHERILEILDWAIENKLINMNIESFIDSNMWDELDKLRTESPSSSNFTEL